MPPITQLGLHAAAPHQYPTTGPGTVVRDYFTPGAFALGAAPRTFTGSPKLSAAYQRGVRTFILSQKDWTGPALLSSFAASCPQDVVIYFAFHHEHEDNIRAGDFTVAEWRSRFNIARNAIKAGNPAIRVGPIHNGRNLVSGSWVFGAGYVEPDLSTCDFWGLDAYVYVSEATRPVGEVYDPWVQYASALAMPVVIGELGAEAGPGQETFARAANRWLRTDVLPLPAACWWDALGGKDYLLSEPSWKAWQETILGPEGYVSVRAI